MTQSELNKKIEFYYNWLGLDKWYADETLTTAKEYVRKAILYGYELGKSGQKLYYSKIEDYFRYLKIETEPTARLEVSYSIRYGHMLGKRELNDTVNRQVMTRRELNKKIEFYYNWLGLETTENAKTLPTVKEYVRKAILYGYELGKSGQKLYYSKIEDYFKYLKIETEPTARLHVSYSIRYGHKLGKRERKN